MCGICGIYHQDRQRNVDPWRIEAMKHALAHRGPDDSGELLQWNLGPRTPTTDNIFHLCLIFLFFNYSEFNCGILERLSHRIEVYDKRPPPQNPSWIRAANQAHLQAARRRRRGDERDEGAVFV